MNVEKNENDSLSANITKFKYNELNKIYLKNSNLYFNDIAYFDFEIRDLKHNKLKIHIVKDEIRFIYKDSNYKKKFLNITCIDQILSRNLICKIKNELIKQLYIDEIFYNRMKVEYIGKSYYFEMVFKIKDTSILYEINKKQILLELRQLTYDIVGINLEFKELDKLAAMGFKKLIYKKRVNNKNKIKINKSNLNKFLEYIEIDEFGRIKK